MKTTSQNITRFKVRQAVGSLAIEGIKLSAETKGMMLQIASGEISAEQARVALIAKYRQTSP